MILKYCLEIPIRTVSESNISCHWTKRKSRKDRQRAIVLFFWNKAINIPIPCKIIFTRIAPRCLDSDNLATSFKFIRDIVADLIKPGYAPGRADAHDIAFEYRQEKGKTKEYAVRIEIYG